MNIILHYARNSGVCYKGIRKLAHYAFEAHRYLYSLLKVVLFAGNQLKCISRHLNLGFVLKSKTALFYFCDAADFVLKSAHLNPIL